MVRVSEICYPKDEIGGNAPRGCVSLDINRLPGGKAIPGLLFAARAAGLDLLEEVVALVVHENEGGEVFHLDFPNGFHAQFGIFHAFDRLNVVLGKDSRRAADGAEIEAAVLPAGIGDLLRAVALGEHHH